MELPSIVEALLVASEDPLSTEEIGRAIRLAASESEFQFGDEAGHVDHSHPHQFAEISKSQVLSAIASLNEFYALNGNSFTLIERSKGWKIFVLPQYAQFVKQLYPSGKPQRLSGPAMETLAIIAYRQPITKAAMEAVRGVSCDGMLQKLLDRELICIGGRANLPGRPLLYLTTDTFFEHFGIKSVEDLPNSNELRTASLPDNHEQPELPSDDKQP